MYKHHSVGLRSELVAAAKYAEKGFEIFWPHSDQGSIDFIAQKGSKTVKVQVKTGQLTESKNCVIMSMILQNPERYKNVDEFACVFENVVKIISYSEVIKSGKINLTLDVVKLESS